MAPRASYYIQDALVDFSASRLRVFLSHGECFFCLSASLFRPDDLGWSRFHQTLTMTLAAAHASMRNGQAKFKCAVMNTTGSILTR